MNTGIAEMNILAFILFIVLLFDAKTSIQAQSNHKLLYRLIFFIILTLGADILFYFMQNTAFQGAKIFKYIIIITYFFSATISAYYWLIFILHEVRQPMQWKASSKFLYTLPLFLGAVMVLCSPFTHWIFFVNEKKQYIHGNLYFLQYLLIYGYIFTGAIVSFIKYKNEILLEKQIICFHLFLYSLLPLLGKGMDFLIPWVHAATPSIIISVIMLYVDRMKKEISLDSLTQLNNRRQFERYLIEITKHSLDKKVSLIFFDINSFKSINDTFGHTEGDKALIAVAQVLKSVFSNTKAFLARYGGDEFAVILRNDENEVRSSLKKIDASLAALSANSPYTLSLSAGYSIYGEENATTIETLIQAADKKMYCDKQEKKSCSSNHTGNPCSR
ncbi:MAG: GGDEF domain-containing protein [Clostridia bacterium]|nr:GGDEF domain-containing protein [Clostridia bacterium]